MKLRYTVSVAITMALMFASPGVAHADSTGNSSEMPTTQTIDQASSYEGIDTSINQSLATSRNDILTSTEAGTIRISNNDGRATVESNSGSLVIEDSNGETLGTDGRKLARVNASKSNNVTYAATVTDTGNIRVYSIIGDHRAPESYSYSFPDVDSIVLDSETGTAFLFKYTGGEPELVGGVDTPWARDASGMRVPTHFEVRGNTLIQVVEHKSRAFTYPITADPSWWNNTKKWLKKTGSKVASKANSAASRIKSAAKWLGPKAKWLHGKTWHPGTKTVARKAGRFLVKKIGPGGLALCAIGGTWAWYRSDASGWVRVGDAVAGCII
ncbi:hypothetical protein O6R08_09465 [Cutibacterium equinum]|uniref:Uncharacterized protein n=1 Tax=Cutibacterium equinum TaxID=3016342 RepID=A0ABY7QXD5_9ACTN|nr:hypothetical protein [Cutibacterium equinum]WCC79705.1 hypothetical protein O6R08_09465 [Cutibacterium equinum]